MTCCAEFWELRSVWWVLQRRPRGWGPKAGEFGRWHLCAHGPGEAFCAAPLCWPGKGVLRPAPARAVGESARVGCGKAIITLDTIQPYTEVEIVCDSGEDSRLLSFHAGGQQDCIRADKAVFGEDATNPACAYVEPKRRRLCQDDHSFFLCAACDRWSSDHRFGFTVSRAIKGAMPVAGTPWQMSGNLGSCNQPGINAERCCVFKPLSVACQILIGISKIQGATALESHISFNAFTHHSPSF